MELELRYSVVVNAIHFTVIVYYQALLLVTKETHFARKVMLLVGSSIYIFNISN